MARQLKTNARVLAQQIIIRMTPQISQNYLLWVVGSCVSVYCIRIPLNDLLASGTSRASTYETTAIPAQQFSPRLLTPKNNREDSARPDGLNWPTKKYCLKQLLPLPETWVPYLANSTCSSLYVSKTSTTLMKIGDWTGTNVHVVLAAGELARAAGAELEDSHK